MRLLWLIAALCVGVRLGATTVDWKTVDWGQAETVVPNVSWLTIPDGLEWAIRMSIPKTKLTSGSIRSRDANGVEVERGRFEVTKVSGGSVAVSAWGIPGAEPDTEPTLPSNHQWFEWRFTATYSKLLSVTPEGACNELASWSSAGLGIVPAEVCLFVSDADVVETALFLQVYASADVPEPSPTLLLSGIVGVALLYRPKLRQFVCVGGFAER